MPPKETWYVPPFEENEDMDYDTWVNKRERDWEDERPWKYQRTDDYYDSWTSDVPFGPELPEGFFWVPPLSDDFEPDWWEDPNWSYDATSSEYQDAENALNEWLNAPVPGYESPDINWDEAFNTVMDLDYTFRPVSPEGESGSPMSWLTTYEGDHPDPSAPPDWMDWETYGSDPTGENGWSSFFSNFVGKYHNTMAGLLSGPLMAAAGMGAMDIAGSTFGKAAIGALGAGAGKGLFNVLTGNGPLRRKKKERERQAALAAAKQGGCSCKEEKPSYTCEEKCAYGRMMAEKCLGCRGYSGKAPGGYRRSYSSYNSSYNKSGGSGYALPYGGSKPRVAGRQYRKTMRQSARQSRRTIRTMARQQRKTNRQDRRASKGRLIGRFRN